MMLFFLQNVFNQTVYHEVRYVLSEPVLEHLEKSGVEVAELKPLKDQEIVGGIRFRDAILDVQPILPGELEAKILDAAELYPMSIQMYKKYAEIDTEYLSPPQIAALEALSGRTFKHKWQLYDALSAKSPAWTKLEKNKLNKPFNKHLDEQLDYIYELFRQNDSSVIESPF